jgi:hypothetical protein
MGSQERGGQPALTCDACGAAMPLDRAVRLSSTRRQLTCPECKAVTEWAIDEPDVIDLRDVRLSDADDADDGVETPGPSGRRGRE